MSAEQTSSTHRHKCHPAFVGNGVCVVRHDNERCEGGHHHADNVEPNTFSARPTRCWTTAGAMSRSGGRPVNTVTIELTDRRTQDARFLQAFKPGQPQGASISFDSVEMLWQVLTPRRWQIVRTLCGAGPVSLRETARRIGRDVKAVHGDVHALLAAGVLEKDEQGRIVFPYDAVHVDFTLRPEEAID